MKKTKSTDKIICSPSDLVTFTGCRHATYLDYKALTEKLDRSESDATAELLQKKGLEHEAAFLESLKNEGLSVVEISDQGSSKTRSEQTIEAMKSGADVIFQASLSDSFWQGYSDFLIKCDTPSDLGDFSYEALDAKLARTADPKHILQLCVYSDLLQRFQGALPEKMHLYLGDQSRNSYLVLDFFHYYAQIRESFKDYLHEIPVESYPEPCQQCTFCHWSDRCQAQWNEDSHLSLVANIQRTQIKKLRNAGIHSVGQLAESGEVCHVEDLDPDVYHRLHSQAKLQHHKEVTGEDRYEILPAPAGKGLDRIPAPNEGDLFFDMEGDPLHPNGLEYLFGVYYSNQGKKEFIPFWAHNHEEEKETFKRFMAFLEEHLQSWPDAFIYHYNHYETTALKRLACRYAVYEEFLDNLLRNKKFVDLYVVVRESLRTSEPGYSIKNLETFYMTKRGNAVANAVESIIVYNRWRESGEDKLLQEIADYNEVDCISTQLLRDWLLKLKSENSSIDQRSTELFEQGSHESARKPWEVEYDQYQERLGVTGENPDPLNLHISHLLEFHNREAKPQWWSAFDRTNRTPEELLEDNECLAKTVQIGDAVALNRSLLYTFQYPAQDFKLKAGTSIVNAVTMQSAGQLIKIDEDARLVEIKAGPKIEKLPGCLSIGPGGPVNTQIIRKAIYHYADQILKEPHAKNCATELLNRNIPRIIGKKSGEPIIINDADIQKAALEAVAALDHSYLFIQGPPGAGKTYTSSHIIVELMKRGKKVGVTSNSHKAIHNLLEKVQNVATDQNFSFQGIKKSSSGNKESEFKSKNISSCNKTEDISTSALLFAGTAWTFAHEHFRDQLDFLFVDEAGQVSTANIVAMSTATKNLILVGDQMQLGQPIQGVHPGEAGLSVLEYLLGEQSTIPAERGIFLEQSRRMRPSICQFISDAFYDGRLKSHESASQRCLELTEEAGLPGEGIVFHQADHEGCSQKSAEEGAIIKTYYEELLGQEFIESDGSSRKIGEKDILVVTPYNVQVNYLKSILPKQARVGTVDKFQGQEAPIVLISMVTSSAEDLPRHLDFLFSKNRLNVAISRAQCLAVVVANPELLHVPCKTLDSMRLVNTFCWLFDAARSPNDNYELTPEDLDEVLSALAAESNDLEDHPFDEK